MSACAVLEYQLLIARTAWFGYVYISLFRFQFTEVCLVLHYVKLLQNLYT